MGLDLGLGFGLGQPLVKGCKELLGFGPGLWLWALAYMAGVLLFLATSGAPVVGPLLPDVHHLTCGTMTGHVFGLPPAAPKRSSSLGGLGCFPVDVIKRGI
jgi:hypothetical protein